jgi:hypothetical protein
VQQNLVGAHDACLAGTSEPFGCRRRTGMQERVVIQQEQRRNKDQPARPVPDQVRVLWGNHPQLSAKPDQVQVTLLTPQLDRIRATGPQLVVPRRPDNGCEPLTEHPQCPLDVRRQLANVTGY